MGWLDALAHRVGLCSRLLLELVYPGGPVLCDQALYLQLLLRRLVEFCRRRQAHFQLSHAASLSLARLDEILSLLHQLANVGLRRAIIGAEHEPQPVSVPPVARACGTWELSQRARGVYV